MVSFQRLKKCQVLIPEVCPLHGSVLIARGIERNAQKINTTLKARNPTGWEPWARTHLDFSYIKVCANIKVNQIVTESFLSHPFLPLNDRTFSRSLCLVDWDPLALYFN